MTRLSKVRVLVADDHAVVREGLEVILGTAAEVEIVGAAADGGEAVELFDKFRPDVLLLDLRMPVMNGLEVTKYLLAKYVSARILIITSFKGDGQIMQCLRAGALGFVLKDAPRKDILRAVKEVARGHLYIPPSEAEFFHETRQFQLTGRETAVLEQVALGKSNKAIAQILGISEGTVKTHLKSLLAKLNAESRTEALVIAVKHGYLDLGNHEPPPSK